MPFSFVDPGVDRVTGTARRSDVQHDGAAAGVGTDRVFTNTDDDADFQNVEFAVNRRFSNKWMMLSSFGYTWSTMYHVNTAGNAARPGIVTTTYRPVDRLFGDNGIETSTLWNYKVIGRYVMPYEIGLSGSWKVQSGFNYGRTMSVNLPVEGARTVRVEPITANRYPTVPDPRRARRQVDQVRPLRHGDAAARRLQPDQRRHGDHGPRDQHRHGAVQRSDRDPEPAGGPGRDSVRVLTTAFRFEDPFNWGRRRRRPHLFVPPM